MSLPQVNQITASMARLKDLLSPAAIEQVPIARSLGRVLAEPLVADRDSPPLDVSAMDGFAVRLADVLGEPLRW